jgi:hypothetical protein
MSLKGSEYVKESILKMQEEGKIRTKPAVHCKYIKSRFHIVIHLAWGFIP